jgi:prepilin-type N-terminal cleavage/methylation domain-containing protein
MKTQKGFTLIELLIVIVIISILAAIIFVAVDPATRFADARNARRRSEVVSILNAVLHYQVDNNGTLPSAIDSVATTSQVLGTAGSGCDTTCTATGANDTAACADLTAALVDEYLATIPMDPLSGVSTNTDYYINKTANGRLLIGACDPENVASITVTR